MVVNTDNVIVVRILGGRPFLVMVSVSGRVNVMVVGENKPGSGASVGPVIMGRIVGGIEVS